MNGLPPAVSVVMPVYNGALYLREAIGSVLAQTFDNFEFIIVDDGSTDESLSIIREYEQIDARIRVISRPNTGIVGALNDGIAAAGSGYIARMDADDICFEQRFEKQVSYLDAHPDCVAVGSIVLMMDPDGSLIRPWALEQTHEEIDGGHLDFRWPIVHPSVMLRRQAIERIGGYRPQYNYLEDLDLFLRLAEVGKLANLPEPLLYYRLHPKSICHTRKDDQAEIRTSIYREAAERRKLPISTDPPARLQRTKSELALYRSWAWCALMSGYRDTARKYTRKVMMRSPFSVESWRLAYCVLRGR